MACVHSSRLVPGLPDVVHCPSKQVGHGDIDLRLRTISFTIRIKCGRASVRFTRNYCRYSTASIEISGEGYELRARGANKRDFGGVRLMMRLAWASVAPSNQTSSLKFFRLPPSPTGQNLMLRMQPRPSISQSTDGPLTTAIAENLAGKE